MDTFELFSSDRWTTRLNASFTTQQINGRAVTVITPIVRLDGTSLTVSVPTSVEISNDIGNPIPISGRSCRVASTFTRPADVLAYAVGDLIANSVTPGSVVVGSMDLGVSEALISAADLRTSNPAGSGAVRVHLFSAAPSVSGGDNAAVAASGAAAWIGSVDVTFSRQMSDGTVGRGVPDAPIAVQLAAGATTLWYLLEVLTAFTPASGSQLTVSLEYVPA